MAVVRKIARPGLAAADAVAPPKTSSARGTSQPRLAAASDASVNRYLAAYIMGVANRLANGASNHYRTHFNIGMSEWRAIMAIGQQDALIVRQVAELADLDYAAASKSVRLLQERGLVNVEQTSGRGRPAIVRMTPEGTETYKKLRDTARRRQRRLTSTFSAEELNTLWTLLRRVEQQVPFVNAD